MDQNLFYWANALTNSGHHLSRISAWYLFVQTTARTILPLVLGAVLASMLATFIQTGFLIHGSAVSPHFNRINPISGFMRLFGLKGLQEVGKAIVKIVVVIIAAWVTLRGQVAGILQLSRMQVETAIPFIKSLGLRILIAGVVVQICLAVLDFLLVRFQFSRQMRMSRRDMKEEYKETEGNPMTKARVRNVGMSRVRRSMMQQVPDATVVITNPTHYAAALSYTKDGSHAPQLVAKGVDQMALAIIDLAIKSHVPVIPNPPLARALFKLELDTEVPPEHYQAVAEIIAYVWGLDRGR
jgi:flagellar biosynthetic protein FlhB